MTQSKAILEIFTVIWCIPPQGNFHPALCQMSLMNFDFKPKFLHTQLAYLPGPYRCYLCGKDPDISFIVVVVCFGCFGCLAKFIFLVAEKH